MCASDDPYTWTEDYVRIHRAECVSCLHRLNENILYDLLEDESYDSIVAGINAIAKGLLKLTLNEIQDEDLDVQAIEYMIAEGLLLVLGDPRKFEELSESARREQALKTFRQALTLGQYYTGRDAVMGMAAMAFRFVDDLEAGVPLYQIQQKQAGEFPNVKETVALTLNEGRKRLGRIAPAGSAPVPAETPYRQQAQYVPASAPASPPPSVSSPPPQPVKAKKRRSRAGLLLVIILVAAALFAGLSLFRAELRSASSKNEEPGDISSFVQDSGFIFPNSDTELIDQQEIEALSDYDLRLAINELYARYGYIFLNEEMDAYYRQFSWYNGVVPPEDFSVNQFNQIEQQNWNLLVGERNKRKDSG